MTLGPELVEKVGISVGCGIAGMLFSYYRRWSWVKDGVNLSKYMFSDSHAIGRALTTSIVLCAGAGTFEYLDNLTCQQIITAGIGLGLTGPEKTGRKTND